LRGIKRGQLIRRAPFNATAFATFARHDIFAGMLIGKRQQAVALEHGLALGKDAAEFGRDSVLLRDLYKLLAMPMAFYRSPRYPKMSA
jgi:hypothetical protein